MTYDISKLNAVVSQAAAESTNLSEASAGGGGTYVPPAAGNCVATLVGYIDLGLRIKKGFQGAKDTQVRQCMFIFELSKGKNAPKVLEDGTKVPHRITIKVWLPAAGKKPSDKSGFFKLFSKLNHNKDPDVKIPAQLLGKHWRVTVAHEEWTPAGSSEAITTANIGNAKDGYNIFPPVASVLDEETGDMRDVVIPPSEILSPIRCFLWEYADKGMWDSLFIDGEYPAKVDDKGNETAPAKTKNVLQEQIKQALDWKGSPMQQILEDGGELDIAEVAEVKEQPSAEDDPLAGML